MLVLVVMLSMLVAVVGGWLEAARHLGGQSAQRREASLDQVAQRRRQVSHEAQERQWAAAGRPSAQLASREAPSTQRST